MAKISEAISDIIDDIHGCAGFYLLMTLSVIPAVLFMVWISLELLFRVIYCIHSFHW